MEQQTLHLVAANLRRAREAKGFTQHEVGVAIGTTGPAVSRWEAGRVEPSPAYRQALANLFFGGDVSALYKEAEPVEA